MASMNVEELIYLCWTDESSTVFRVHFDTDTWKLITEEAQNVYLKETPKCPTRLSAESKVIKERLHIFRENNCEFICEVASCKGERIGCSYLVDGSPYVYPICNTEERNNLTVDEMDSIFSSINTCINEAYQICRKKATEVIVWILADTDRIFNPDVPYAIPIAYAMKGYSLGTKPMREMHEDVLRMCHEKKINVVASCFDGQWAKLSTRDKNDKPLTIMQLQRDVYSEASKLTRDAIVKKLLSESILPAEQIFSITEKTEEGLKVSSPMLKRITLSLRHKLKQKKRSSVVQNLDSDTVSCLPDEALETLIVEDNHTMFPDRIDVEEETTSENTVGDNDDEDNDMNEVADQTKNDKPVPPETVAAIFHSLTIHTKVSVSRKWSKRTVSDLIKILDDTSLVRKMQHDELNVVIQLTKTQQLKLGIKIKQTCCRDEKAIFIRRVFGSKQDEIFEKKVKELMPLKLIASKVVRTCLSKIPKERLNNTVAAMMIDKRYCEWKEASAFKLDTEIYNIGKTIWFSFPEFDEEKQKMEPKCLDAHHLLVNLRCKVCKDGVWGIRKDAWHAVADSDNNIISKGIVVDLLDKQNNAFAKRTFSNEVEEQMRKLDFVSEANFCYMIRRWYEAEDSAGFSAEDRIQRKLQLKAFLLKDVDFGIFPPPGMYVKGFPKIMYEGFLQRIDTSIQLYDIVKSGSYNQRALSSLVNETFFGELSELEPTKLGCPKAISIPRLMANVTEMQHFRCDPSERAFNINTSRRPVYPQHSLLPVTDKTEICVATYTECNHQIPQIYPRNHTFDSPSRLNKKQRKSKRSDVSKPNAVSRGCLPIRQHHKCDESKVLPTTRLGIELQD
ncbi:uncharacterized protein [Mytilus edulis]